MDTNQSVFIDESKLDVNYIPSRLPHRDLQLSLLNQFFRFSIERCGKMTQRVMISGKIGTGKTVLSQRFGLDITKKAEERGISLHYIHVNCRECRGSFFMILRRIIQKFCPRFPRSGYSAEELLHLIIRILDRQNSYLILTLDELESLIRKDGFDPIYILTHIQENRLDAPLRLSLLCILSKLGYLGILDPRTRSILQSNTIHLEEYSIPQLQDILSGRVALAFRHGTVSKSVVELIAELANLEKGDARYAIELLWEVGKYADAKASPRVLPEYVRKAAINIYSKKDMILSLVFHEKLFLLGIVRCFKQTKSTYISMGEAEGAYAIVCKEYNEKRRGHTQLWKYAKELSALGIINTKPSGLGKRGKTTLISLLRMPASKLEQELMKILNVNKS